MDRHGQIGCRTAPAGRIGPLIPRLEQSIRILVLQVELRREWPRGLNVDGLLVFDMQADGGVDSIEILHPVGACFRSGVIRPRRNEKYWRLFLDESASAGKLQVNRTGAEVMFWFEECEVDSKYLIGPNTQALVRKNVLVGLSVDLEPLMIGTSV